ncbi:hypothetical protein [Tenacibaculum sp. nBUS_03]|uniref:hypothetical protein n=1 Tax=Tenacibaculum sp. nBUS_03 TaxID=3395320 RepID=UPI003EC05F7C
MRKILNIKDDEVILYEITDQYLFDCNKSNIAIEKKKLYLDYLNNCDFESILLDQTECIFSKDLITHFETIKTDGDWLWSGDLEHYFDRFNFFWPEDHLKKIEKSNYKMTKESKIIINERNDLEAKLYNHSYLPIDSDPFQDLIVQNRRITRIKLTTTPPKLH